MAGFVKAVVLVGGEGTRLRPLTLFTPKTLLPVAGRPVIERVVEHLAQHGVDEVVLSLGYKPDAPAAYPDGRCGDVRLHYAIESSPLDTAGAIAFAAGEAGIGDQTFIVVNGDILTEFDISALVRFHQERGGAGSIALTPVADPSRFGVAPWMSGARSRLSSRSRRPYRAHQHDQRRYIRARAFLFGARPRPAGGCRSSGGFPAMVEAGSLYALGSDALWTDMGTPEKYLEANLAWGRQEASLVGASEGPGSEAAGALAIELRPGAPGGAYPGATIANRFVHPGVRIDEGAQVHDAVVLDGGYVRAGATVRRSVIGPNVTVGLGAVVDELSILGDGWEVAAGAVLSGARLPVA